MRRRIVVGTAHPGFARQIAHVIQHVLHDGPVSCATTVDRLREMVGDKRPELVILDQRLFPHKGLASPVAEVAALAPVILVGLYERQLEVAPLIAAGQVEFVPHANHWVALLAALAERKLRPVDSGDAAYSIPDEVGGHLSEIFRHEINNPLTGILGNAELLLVHSDRFPASDTQRIRIIVELAVRLREAVRRASNACAKLSGSQTREVLQANGFSSGARA